jgi:hypothetical protein
VSLIYFHLHTCFSHILKPAHVCRSYTEHSKADIFVFTQNSAPSPPLTILSLYSHFRSVPLISRHMFFLSTFLHSLLYTKPQQTNILLRIILMSVPCNVGLSVTAQHCALIITPLFDTQAPTCFGTHMPSSGSFLCPYWLLKAEMVMLFVIYCECWLFVCTGCCGLMCYVAQLSA